MSYTRLQLEDLFEEAIALYESYYRTNSETKGFNKDSAMEVINKLKKLQWLFNRIWNMEDEANYFSQEIVKTVASGNQVPQERLVEHSSNELEIEILTEAFYYIAWRVLGSLLCHIFPEIKGQVKGVDNVRNKLIEHPHDKDSKVFLLSFSHGGTVGPVIKSVRYTEQISIYPDKGLWPNIDEFLSKLIEVLKARGF